MLHWLPAHSALQVLCARRDNVCSAPSSDTTTDCVHVLFQLHTHEAEVSASVQPWRCLIQLMPGCLSSHALPHVIKHRRSAFKQLKNKHTEVDCTTTEYSMGRRPQWCC